MGGWLDLVKLGLTQPQVELEARAELDNYNFDRILLYVKKDNDS